VRRRGKHRRSPGEARCARNGSESRHCRSARSRLHRDDGPLLARIGAALGMAVKDFTRRTAAVGEAARKGWQTARNAVSSQPRGNTHGCLNGAACATIQRGAVPHDRPQPPEAQPARCPQLRNGDARSACGGTCIGTNLRPAQSGRQRTLSGDPDGLTLRTLLCSCYGG